MRKSRKLESLFTQASAVEAATGLQQGAQYLELKDLPYVELRERCRKPEVRETCRRIWEERAKAFPKPFYPTSLSPEERYLQLTSVYGSCEPGSERYVSSKTCLQEAIQNGNWPIVDYFLGIIDDYDYREVALWTLRSNDPTMNSLLAKHDKESENGSVFNEALAILYSLQGDRTNAIEAIKHLKDINYGFLLFAIIAGGNVGLLEDVHKRFGDDMWEEWRDAPSYLLQAKLYNQPEMYRYLADVLVRLRLVSPDTAEAIFRATERELDYVADTARFVRFGRAGDLHYSHPVYWTQRHRSVV